MGIQYSDDTVKDALTKSEAKVNDFIQNFEEMPQIDPALEMAKETLMWLQVLSLMLGFSIAVASTKILRRQLRRQIEEWGHHRSVLSALKLRTLFIYARRNHAYTGAYLPKALIDSPKSSLYSSLENDYENPDYDYMMLGLDGPQDLCRRADAARRSGCYSRMSDPYEEVCAPARPSAGDGTPEHHEKVGTPEHPEEKVGTTLHPGDEEDIY